MQFYHSKITIMKTNLIFLKSILLLCAILFLSCEDTIEEFYDINPDTPQQVEPFAESGISSSTELPIKTPLLKPFFYGIDKSSCTQQGYTLKVLIYKPYNYQYSWIIDDQPAGNGIQVHCTTGLKVYLTVTRYSDNMSISKYLELPPSNHEGVSTELETVN